MIVELTANLYTLTLGTGKVNLIIIQIINIDPAMLLVLCPSIAKPAHGIVIAILVLKIFPARVGKYFHGVQGGSYRNQLLSTSLAGKELTRPESNNTTILSTTLIPAAALGTEYSSGKVLITVPSEALHGLSLHRHGTDIVALDLARTISEVIQLFLDQQQEITLAQTCIWPEADEVVREPVSCNRDVSLWRFLPVLSKGDAATTLDWESWCTCGVKASGTDDSINSPVLAVCGQYSLLIDFHYLRPDDLDFLVGQGLEIPWPGSQATTRWWEGRKKVVN